MIVLITLISEGKVRVGPPRTDPSLAALTMRETGEIVHEDRSTEQAKQMRIPKAAGLVAGSIRRQIVRKELRDGQSLPPESALLKEYGVSRPTLREAMRVLEAEALITIRRGARGGARVNVPTGVSAARYAGLLLEYRQVTTADVFAAATGIEAPRAGTLAADHTAEDITRLREALRREKFASSDPVSLLAAQNDFHRLVVDLGGNQTLRVLSDMLREIIDKASHRSVDREPHSLAAAHAGSRTHVRLVQFIESNDHEAAERLWHRHITETGTHLIASGAAKHVLDLLN